MKKMKNQVQIHPIPVIKISNKSIGLPINFWITSHNVRHEKVIIEEKLSREMVVFNLFSNNNFEKTKKNELNPVAAKKLGKVPMKNSLTFEKCKSNGLIIPLITITQTIETTTIMAAILNFLSGRILILINCF
jgi:hypothetical protein